MTFRFVTVLFALQERVSYQTKALCGLLCTLTRETKTAMPRLLQTEALRKERIAHGETGGVYLNPAVVLNKGKLLFGPETDDALDILLCCEDEPPWQPRKLIV